MEANQGIPEETRSAGFDKKGLAATQKPEELKRKYGKWKHDQRRN
jgi:hypothetical protein